MKKGTHQEPSEPGLSVVESWLDGPLIMLRERPARLLRFTAGRKWSS